MQIFGTTLQAGAFVPVSDGLGAVLDDLRHAFFVAITIVVADLLARLFVRAFLRLGLRGFLEWRHLVGLWGCPGLLRRGCGERHGAANDQGREGLAAEKGRTNGHRGFAPLLLLRRYTRDCAVSDAAGNIRYAN